MVIARPGEFRLHRCSQIAPILVTVGRPVVVIISVVVWIVIVRIAIRWEPKREEEAIIKVVVMMEEAVPIVVEEMTPVVTKEMTPIVTKEMTPVVTKEMTAIVVKREIMST
jgi:hypothetical protein